MITAIPPHSPYRTTAVVVSVDYVCELIKEIYKAVMDHIDTINNYKPPQNGSFDQNLDYVEERCDVLGPQLEDLSKRFQEQSQRAKALMLELHFFQAHAAAFKNRAASGA